MQATASLMSHSRPTGVASKDSSSNVVGHNSISQSQVLLHDNLVKAHTASTARDAADASQAYAFASIFADKDKSWLDPKGFTVTTEDGEQDVEAYIATEITVSQDQPPISRSKYLLLPGVDFFSAMQHVYREIALPHCSTSRSAAQTCTKIAGRMCVIMGLERHDVTVQDATVSLHEFAAGGQSELPGTVLSALIPPVQFDLQHVYSQCSPASGGPPNNRVFATKISELDSQQPDLLPTTYQVLQAAQQMVNKPNGSLSARIIRAAIQQVCQKNVAFAEFLNKKQRSRRKKVDLPDPQLDDNLEQQQAHVAGSKGLCPEQLLDAAATAGVGQEQHGAAAVAQARSSSVTALSLEQRIEAGSPAASADAASNEREQLGDAMPDPEQQVSATSQGQGSEQQAANPGAEPVPILPTSSVGQQHVADGANTQQEELDSSLMAVELGSEQHCDVASVAEVGSEGEGSEQPAVAATASSGPEQQAGGSEQELVVPASAAASMQLDVEASSEHQHQQSATAIPAAELDTEQQQASGSEVNGHLLASRDEPEGIADTNMVQEPEVSHPASPQQSVPSVPPIGSEDAMQLVPAVSSTCADQYSAWAKQQQAQLSADLFKLSSIDFSPFFILLCFKAVAWPTMIAVYTLQGAASTGWVSVLSVMYKAALKLISFAIQLRCLFQWDIQRHLPADGATCADVEKLVQLVSQMQHTLDRERHSAACSIDCCKLHWHTVHVSAVTHQLTSTFCGVFARLSTIAGQQCSAEVSQAPAGDLACDLLAAATTCLEDLTHALTLISAFNADLDRAYMPKGGLDSVWRLINAAKTMDPQGQRLEALASATIDDIGDCGHGVKACQLNEGGLSNAPGSSSAGVHDLDWYYENGSDMPSSVPSSSSGSYAVDGNNKRHSGDMCEAPSVPSKVPRC